MNLRNHFTIGSSPHARGTRGRQVPRHVVIRFIPACAGNALPSDTRNGQMPVHPRMRGERSFVLGPVLEHVGSSPHARGTLSSVLPAKPPPRFIPACAGNAPAWAWCPPPRAVHPRMRGERLMNTPMLPQSIGSSPHARGTLAACRSGGQQHRFIPACAGNASANQDAGRYRTVHPRMRGERRKPSLWPFRPVGSSPHARGTPVIHDRLT